MERMEARAGGVDVGRGIGGARSSEVRGKIPARIAVGALAVLLSFGAVPDEDTFGRALSLATEKRYAEAREVLEAVLEREPDHVEGRLLYGVLHARDGRLGEAIETFEALRREHPEMTEPYNNLAVLYALEGRLEEARETLLVILERHPDPVAYANLGDVYTKLAQSAYARARELDSGGGRAGAAEMDADVRGAGADAGVLPGPVSMATSRRLRRWSRGPWCRSRPRPIRSNRWNRRRRWRRHRGRVPARHAAPDSGEAAGAMAPAVCARAGGFEGRRAVAEAALWLQSQGSRGAGGTPRGRAGLRSLAGLPAAVRELGGGAGEAARNPLPRACATSR